MVGALVWFDVDQSSITAGVAVIWARSDQCWLEQVSSCTIALKADEDSV